MERIRFGIVGLGRIAEKFAQAFSEGAGPPHAELAAVAATDPARAEAFAARFGVPHALESYDALLASGDVDVVYVAVTNNAHFEVCMRVIRAGKHLLCEKPMAMRYEEAARIAAAAKEKGVFAMEAMWSRFLPASQRIQDWLRKGAIGRLLLADITVSGYRSQETYRRLFCPELGGGALFDLGVYGVEALLDYVGVDAQIAEVSAFTMKNERQVDWMTNVGIRFTNGAAGLVKCSITASMDNISYLYGEKGYIRIGPTVNHPEEVALFVGPRGGEERLVEQFCHAVGNGMEFQIEHVARCIAEGKRESGRMPLSDTLKCARIFDAALG